MLFSIPALVIIFVAIAMALPGDSDQQASADACTHVAASDGSDAAAGTASAPWATAQKLIDSLAPGELGCLRSGTYVEDLRFSNGGQDGRPVTLRSYPGERATIRGRMWIARGADYVTVSSLDLDGSNPDVLPSPTINANNSTFVDNDVTNHNQTICFAVGHATWGRAVNTVIRGNRIHNCGILPANNHDHGIYVVAADNTQIIGNWIYDNADRGIQLYPDAQHSYIAGNVIDGNGQGIIFSGDYGMTSSDNVVENNVITNAKLRANVESFYPQGNPVGERNVVRNNCVSGGARDNGNGGIAEANGFSLSGNVVTNPGYQNRAAKDFRLDPSNPCAAILAGGAGTDNPGRGTGTGNGAGNGTQTGSPGRTTPVRGGRVVVKLRKRGRSKFAITGRVSSRGGLVAASSAGRKAIVQIRFDGSWYPVRSTPIVGGKFSSQLKLPASFRGKIVKLRVQVDAVGRSSVKRIRG